MKNINRTGLTLLLIGVFILFRKERYFYGFGGRVDNCFEILFSSLVVILIGLFVIYFKTFKKC